MALSMRSRVLMLKKVFFVLGITLVSPWLVAQTTLEQMWVTPTFETGQPAGKSIIIETKFDYHLYEPKKGFEKVNLVRRKHAGLESARKAFVARMSAVTSLDYEWWLDTWEVNSKELALEYYQRKGLDKDYWLKTWKEKFVGRKIILKQLIDYEGYTIFVYNVANKNGTPGYLDVPVVFEQSGDDWLVSLDIRQSPLLHFSPWVEGRDTEVMVYE
jgi:hypothetical protein